jgi:NAD(P)-dependent dehydrogenase (short-subunit alcohol dehydrogenase family)
VAGGRVRAHTMTSHSEGEQLPSFRLDDRIAVITGASQGIGRAFAIAFSRAGAEVILVARHRERLLEAHREVEAAGSKAHVISANLTRIDDINSLAENVSKIVVGREQSLILLNNAGFGFTKPALDVTEEDWDRLLDLHVKGTFFCSQAIGRLMIDRGYGKIINMSSTWSTSTDIGKSTYGLAKAAVSHLTAALSTEWAPWGVRVNAIAPTTTLSENTKRHVAENPIRAQQLQKRIKLGRFAEPSDLLGAAIFLASPASDFVTGHTLFVDGGWHAAG